MYKSEIPVASQPDVWLVDISSDIWSNQPNFFFTLGPDEKVG